MSGTVPTEDPRTLWQEKLDFYLAEQAKASDPAQKFQLHKAIQEARAKLAETDARLPSRHDPAVAAQVNLAGAGHFFSHPPELAALLEAVRDKGLVLFPASALSAAATGTLTATATETAPLPDADLADLVSQQIVKDLARIRARYLNGERSAAIAELDALLSHPARSHLAASLRGRLLRTAALYGLGSGQDRAEAEALAEQAAAEDPSGDGQALAAHLALQRGDKQAARALLEVPRSPQARHLKAAILIEDGDGEAALDLLAEPAGSAEGSASDATSPAEPTDAAGNTAETWRLRALAYVVLKRLPEAVAAIDAARSLAPGWVAVRSAKALIDFWCICTPAALDLSEQPLWPMPFWRGLVRADAGPRLSEIERTFAAVADTLPAGSIEQGHWLTWRLIALLAADDRREAATDLARHLIGEDGPLHIWPLLWARFFDIAIDRNRLKERLKCVSAEEPNFIPLTDLYVELRLEDGDAEAVMAEIKAITSQIEALGHPEVPRQWQVLALSAAGRLDEADALVDTIGAERLRLRMRLHIARGREAETPGSHKAAAAALLAVDPGPDVLSEACDAHAKAGEWAFVSAHADALLNAIPTPGSLRLLVIATFNQGEYQRCVSALDDHRDLYADGRLPDDFALLRVRCQRILGEPSLAVRDAQALYDQAQTAGHLVELLNAQLATANIPGILDALRRLALIEPAEGELLLQGARIAAQLDRDLAIALWRRAVAHGQEDAPFVLQAVTLGESLGLDPDETGPWFRRMSELAESGDHDIQKLHISEILQLIREREEAERQWLDKLWHGEIAAHLLTNGLPGLFPAMLHANPQHNRIDPDPLEQPPILIRHGARPLGLPKPRLEPRPRLILDLSALMTAQSLGLLDRVETAFAPLWLHRHWHQLLRTEVGRLMSAQPRDSAVHAQIGELIRCGGIVLVDLDPLHRVDESLSAMVGDPVARELEWARTNDGRLLTYLPLHGADIEQWCELDLPSPWGEVVLGPRALLDGLLTEGMIDTDRHRDALSIFPAEPDTGNPPRLPAVAAVLLSNTGMLGEFAELGLLMGLSHRFRLQVPMQDWERDERQETVQRQRDELADWITALIERVSTGFNDRYRLLPAHGPGPDAEIPKHNGLDDLLSYPGEPGDLLWVDDRFLNGFPYTGRMPIVGVVAILDLLREQGAIDQAERFDLLHRLRASNYRFIPLDADEILHWLGQTDPQSDRLIVPTQLDRLARYWAACLYQGDALQWTGNDRHGQGEIPFFVSSQSAVSKVLRAIWSDDRLNLNRRRQLADWVLDKLYVGVGDILHLVPEPSPERDMSLVGMDQAGLCFEAFQILVAGFDCETKENKEDSNLGEDRTERALSAAAEYLRWVCTRIVAPRLLADPSSAAPTAAAFRSLLLGRFARDDDELLPLVGSWLRRFLPILPSVLHDELHKDQDLMQRLKLEQVTYLAVGDLHFRVRDFWPAVQGALRGAVWIVQDIDRGEPFSLRLVSETDAPRPLLDLADRCGKSAGCHYYEFSEMFLDARNLRLDALRVNPHWWDGDPRNVEAIERDLSAIESAAQRVREVRQIMARSADAHYLALEEELQRAKARNEGLPLDRCFPPPLSAVLTYLRCAAASTDGVSLAGQCWDLLFRSVPVERGLAESLNRITLLPCPLHDAVHRSIAALDMEPRRDLLKLTASGMTHAVGHLHLVDLLLASAPVLPEALDLAQEQIRYLSSSHFADELKLTRALVDLAYRAFGAEAEEGGIEPHRQLLAAWVHAGRITGFVRRAGVNATHLAKALQQWAPFPYRDLYANRREPMPDLAWSWNVEVADLIFAGLGRILSKYPDFAPRLDLSALQARLARLDGGAPDPLRDVHLLRDTGLLTDSMGCLWGGDRSVSLTPLIGQDQARRFAPDGFAGLVDGWLDALEVEPQHAGHWHSLYITVLRGTLPNAIAVRLDAILGRLDLDALIASDHLLLIPLMDLAVRYRSDRESVVGQINRWAEGVDSGCQPIPTVRSYLGAKATHVFSVRVIEWLHGLAARHPQDPDGEFARLLDGLVRRSRTLAAELRGTLINVSRHLPFTRHRALRRTLLAARARPAPTITEASVQAPADKRPAPRVWRKKRRKLRGRSGRR